MTLGQDIKQLSLTLEGISKEQLSWISRLIKNYTEKTLNIHRIRVFVERFDSEKPILERRSLGDVDSTKVESISIKDSKNNYQGQSFMSFDHSIPLWIVSKNGQRDLQKTDEYLDFWSNRKNIPKYRPKTKDREILSDTTRTSISIPLKKRQNKRVFGVVNFSSSQYIEPTDEAKNELTRLATAISYLYDLYDVRSISDNHTNMAIDVLEKRNNVSSPNLMRPTIFIASSSKADKEVIETILSTVKQYSDKS